MIDVKGWIRLARAVWGLFRSDSRTETYAALLVAAVAAVVGWYGINQQKAERRT